MYVRFIISARGLDTQTPEPTNKQHLTIFTMGIWILEPKSDEKVPGTIHIRRDTERDVDLTRDLKHGTGRHANTVLVPQPSDSPDDPLSK